MDQTLEQQVDDLKRLGGVDVTKVPVGTTIIIETTHAIYEIIVLFPSMALLEIIGTDKIFSAQKGSHSVELQHSTYDQGGNIRIPHWIGKGMRMAFKTDDGVIMTSAVCSARVTSPDKSWSYELWEKTY